jgi:hypothetical protein
MLSLSQARRVASVAFVRRSQFCPLSVICPDRVQKLVSYKRPRLFLGNAAAANVLPDAQKIVIGNGL